MSVAVEMDSTASKPTPPSGPRPNCCRRMVQPIINVVYSGISAESLALAFALGAVCGIVPLPMITSLVGALFCWLCRANIIASTAINYVMTPFHLAMLVPWIRAGEWLFGVKEPVAFSLAPFSESFFGAVSMYSGALGRAACAWLICAPFATAILYYILLVVLRPLLAAKKVAAQ